MQAIHVVHRFGWPSRLLIVAASLLFVKTFVAILVEYRWYFPPDFEASAFLTGRRESFRGIYPAAFYTHLVSGPLALVFGVMLMLTGGRPRFRTLHRLAGRGQMLLVLLAVVPSGLVMAAEAYSGPIAGCGFAALSLATGACALAAIWHARARCFASHRLWASRCFVLLGSPLLLRIVAGATIVTGIESEWTYRLNAWLSWLVPLAIFEAWRRRASPSISPHSAELFNRSMNRAPA